MENSLSIRSYTRTTQSHRHDFHQLVLPIQGTICLELDDYHGRVAVGECVVIKAGIEHHFNADEAAKFIVADLSDIPANLMTLEFVIFSVSSPLLSFLYFVEKQLEFQVNSQIEKTMLKVFFELLGQQNGNKLIDPRIRSVLAYIVDHLETELTIESLASVACLSPTQFKKRFREALGCSVFQHIIQKRMEKAKALLTHTDLPIQLIGERVGYQDVSAFSRRFSHYFGLSPKAFTR